MTTTNAHDDRGLVIKIEQEFPATQARVFRRWTDANALARWFAPPGYVTELSEADSRPGGKWRLDFHAQSGEHRYTEQGVYREIDPFKRLVLTLTQVDGSHTNPETLVTVDLDDIGTAEMPRTRMRFTQRGYRSASLRDDNEQGWRGCFTALAHDLISEAGKSS